VKVPPGTAGISVIGEFEEQSGLVSPTKEESQGACAFALKDVNVENNIKNTKVAIWNNVLLLLIRSILNKLLNCLVCFIKEMFEK
jgi:hypothetical protein